MWDEVRQSLEALRKTTYKTTLVKGRSLLANVYINSSGWSRSGKYERKEKRSRDQKKKWKRK